MVETGSGAVVGRDRTDEILAALDSDTRDYLVLLLNDGAQGLGGEVKGRELAQAIRRLEPTAKYARAINEGLAERRRAEQARSALWSEIGDTLLDRFRASPSVAERLADFEREVMAGTRSPSVVARTMLAAFLGEPCEEKNGD